jgi:hypothetical protein
VFGIEVAEEYSVKFFTAPDFANELKLLIASLFYQKP